MEKQGFFSWIFHNAFYYVLTIGIYLYAIFGTDISYITAIIGLILYGVVMWIPFYIYFYIRYRTKIPTKLFKYFPKEYSANKVN